MINFAMGFLFVGLVTAFWTAYYGIVTRLPWGLQEPMEFFMATINTIRNVMPWFDTIWTVFCIALIVKVALFTFYRVIWTIDIIRG